MADDTEFLFRKGDTFYTYDTIYVSDSYSDVYISSYEDGSDPSDDKPIIYIDTTDNLYNNIFYLSGDNCTVNDLALRSGGNYTEEDSSTEGYLYPSGINLSGVNGLVLDCDLSYFGVEAFRLTGSYNTIQGCTVTNVSRYGVYGSGPTGSALIGNYITDFESDHEEHVVRFQGSDYSYIAYNDFRANECKDNTQIRGDSTYAYVWNNQFDRVVGFNPQNSASEEYIHHCAFDSNISVARDYSSGPSYDYEGIALNLKAKNIVVRNNISYGYGKFLAMWTHDLVGAPEDIYIYNNTDITDQELSAFVNLSVDCDNVHIKNNIYHNQNTTSNSYADGFIYFVDAYYTDFSKLPVWTDYNIFLGEAWDDEDTQIVIRPEFTLAGWQTETGGAIHSIFADALVGETMDVDNVQDSLDNGFASLSASSAGVNAGYDRSRTTLFDFNGNKRTQNDIGAIKYER